VQKGTSGLGSFQGCTFRGGTWYSFIYGHFVSLARVETSNIFIHGILVNENLYVNMNICTHFDIDRKYCIGTVSFIEDVKNIHQYTK